MKPFRIFCGLAAPALVLACASTAPQEQGISSEMQEAIDTYVRIQADPPPVADGGTAAPVARTQTSSDGTSGIDPVKLGGALKAGATYIPSGGAALGATGAGNGGTGVPGLSGGTAGSSTGAGNGGAAVGSTAGGGSTSFAESACYMIGNLCRYIARCSTRGTSDVSEACRLPANCAATVSAALVQANATIPPQASTILRCFGDALGSAPCVTDGNLATGLSSSFGRCGLSIRASE